MSGCLTDTCTEQGEPTYLNHRGAIPAANNMSYQNVLEQHIKPPAALRMNDVDVKDEYLPYLG